MSTILFLILSIVSASILFIVFWMLSVNLYKAYPSYEHPIHAIVASIGVGVIFLIACGLTILI